MDKKIWSNYLNALNNYSGSDTGHIGHIKDFFMKHYKKEMSVLDVGCGNKSLKEFVDDYTGVDEPQDIHVLPYHDNSFDVVFCNHVLEHVLSPIIVLSEMRRVLKDDGMIIIGVPICPSFLCKEHITVLTDDGWRHIFKYVDLNLEYFEDKSHSAHYILKKINGK